LVGVERRGQLSRKKEIRRMDFIIARRGENWTGATANLKAIKANVQGVKKEGKI